MSNKINGRTPEEIKRGLECCNTFNACSSCPYEHIVDTEHGWGCVVIRNADTLALIQQLERERDAAVEQLKQADKENLLECTHCKHNVRCSEILLGCNDCDNSECPCSTCVDFDN